MSLKEKRHFEAFHRSQEDNGGCQWRIEHAEWDGGIGLLKQMERNPYSWQLAFVPGIQCRMAGYPGLIMSLRIAQIPPTRKQEIGHQGSQRRACWSAAE